MSWLFDCGDPSSGSRERASVNYGFRLGNQPLIYFNKKDQNIFVFLCIFSFIDFEWKALEIRPDTSFCLYDSFGKAFFSLCRAATSFLWPAQETIAIASFFDWLRVPWIMGHSYLGLGRWTSFGWTRVPEKDFYPSLWHDIPVSEEDSFYGFGLFSPWHAWLFLIYYSVLAVLAQYFPAPAFWPLRILNLPSNRNLPQVAVRDTLCRTRLEEPGAMVRTRLFQHLGLTGPWTSMDGSVLVCPIT